MTTVVLAPHSPKQHWRSKAAPQCPQDFVKRLTAPKRRIFMLLNSVKPEVSPTVDTIGSRAELAPLAANYIALILLNKPGAGEGIRTLDPNLGKGLHTGALGTALFHRDRSSAASIHW
jgi:hypothetical protein